MTYAELPVHQLSRSFGGRRLFHLRPAPEFLAWLQSAGIYHGNEPAPLARPRRRQLMQGLESSLEKTV